MYGFLNICMKCAKCVHWRDLYCLPSQKLLDRPMTMECGNYYCLYYVPNENRMKLVQFYAILNVPHNSEPTFQAFDDCFALWLPHFPLLQRRAVVAVSTLSGTVCIKSYRIFTCDQYLTSKGAFRTLQCDVSNVTNIAAQIYCAVSRHPDWFECRVWKTDVHSILE
jgi:hypothetical protein